jgi:TatD DNase family protein
MIDTHCHLNFKAFSDDAHTIANQMADAGVKAVVVGCDHLTTRSAIDLAQTFPNLWASVGLHPTHVLDNPWDHMQMKELALEDRVVAIGEVGLDFYRFPEDPALKEPYIAKQYETFNNAIALAIELDKPLIIHSREAYDEIIEVLKNTEGNLRGTVHCFMGTWTQAQQLLDLGFMIGFTGVITYKDASQDMLEAATNIPDNKILIETDAPYLTPEPYRTEGRKKDKKTPRNLPQYTNEVAKKLAELRGSSEQAIITHTENNAKTLFNLEGAV